MTKKILVISGHPDLSSSKANNAILEHLEYFPVTIHNLQDHHSDFSFCIDKEQALLAAHDRIVLLFPLYWYSAPALMKKWLEDVIAPGFAIGRGDKLKGKEIMVVTTIGAPEEGYCSGGFNRFTIDELLRPLEQLVYRIKARYITPIKIYQASFLDADSLKEKAQDVGNKITQEYEDPALQYERMVSLVPDLWLKKDNHHIYP